jgi:sigma-54 dependent transcriptional regulator, acetoin dehydrogenase operon transcriptional activator AcoR
VSAITRADSFPEIECKADPKESRSKLERLWEEFIRRQAIPEQDLRPAILDSWQRCLDQDVSPQKPEPLWLSDRELQRRLMVHREYVEAIQPVIDCVNDLVGASNHVIAFLDREGYILTIYGKQELRELLSQLNFSLGANWGERSAGTTAVSMAMATGQPSHVFHAEHYCQGLQEFTCTAVPIRDPFTLEISGILDFVAYVEDHQPHAMGMALQMGRCIELEVYRNRKERDEFFRECSTQLTLDEMERGVMVLDENDRIRRANLKAVEYLNLRSDKFLNMRFDELPVSSELKDSDRGSFSFTFNGQRVRMERKPLVHQQRCIGSLILFENQKSGAERRHATGASPGENDHLPVGHSPAFRKVLDSADHAASCQSNLLILGKTGTGKEVIARYVHEKSPRRNKPFVAINCGSIPRELLGSELFGYEGGAFTGAKQKGHPSKFELANGGTLLLDEISEMPLDSQVYLLRVIEERSVNRLGGCHSIPVDIRIIAASNKDLHREVEADRFRADLLFRINVLRIDLPTLQERKEDIPLLVEHFMQELSAALGRNPIRIDPSALAAYAAYEWPGNIRELRNSLEQAIVMTPGDTIRIENLPEHIQRGCVSSADVREKNRQRYLDFVRIFHQNQGNISKVAKILNISRPTVYAWCKKYGLP